MDANLAGNNRLLIRQLEAQYLVSREHPAPARVKARLDETVARNLAPTLAAALAPWFANSNPGLWLIRKLDVELDVNVTWERDRLAKAVASGIARSLAVSVQGGSDGENILWFPNRAAYLARFLVDVAENCAWSKWYYESFEGLRLLPVSAIVRTAVCDQPDRGREALQQLSANEMSRVLGVLTRQDERRILDGLAEKAKAGEDLLCFQAVWDAMQGEPLDGGDEWRDALRLYLAAGRGGGDVGGIPLRAAALALLRLFRSLAGSSPAEGAKILAALIDRDHAALYAAAGASGGEGLLPMFGCPTAWIRHVGEALLGSHSGQAQDDAPAAEWRHTPFGGIFLLLPLLDELPLEEATRGWPDTTEVSAAAMVRLLLLIKCLGRPRATRAFLDPLVRDLAGVPVSLTSSHLAAWQVRVSPVNLRTFRETWAKWYVERGMVQDRIWVIARIPAPGSPLALAMDGARGVWLYVGRHQPLRPLPAVEALQLRLDQCQQDPPVMLCDPMLVDVLRSAFPGLEVLSLTDHSVSKLAEDDQPLTDVLARLDKLPGDLMHLTAPKSLGLSRSLDTLMSVAAQNLLRGLAWRLPGFAGSNLPYLYSSFLDFAGSVEDEPERRVVRLGKPPLHLILNMTGLARQSYRLRWLDERPFTLFPGR